MQKTYLSELHTSFNIQGNPYVILNANEFSAIKDNNSLSKYFTDAELKQIIGNSVSTRIFLQDAEKIVYKAEDYATINKLSLFTDKNFSTYIINFNKNLTYPIKIIFEHSYRLNLYSNLKEKLKNRNFINSLTQEDVQTLFNQTVEHEESLLNFNNSVRTKISLETSDIDPRKYTDVKERVHYVSNITQASSAIQNYSVEDDGFATFPLMILNNLSTPIPYENTDSLVEFYTKLINIKNDFDYKRFLFSKGVYDIKEEKIISSTSPEDARTNVVNTSTFSEDKIFKSDDTSLKTSNSNNSPNLFLMFILNTDEIVLPTNPTEIENYNSFLSNSFLYPNYFFKHIMKYKLEYLFSVDEKSLYETWQEVNSNNLSQIINQKTMCRISLKNKKYYDKLAYEYFIVGV